MSYEEMSVLDVDHMMSVMQRRCASSNIRLEWAADQPIAATSKDGTIILPQIHHPVGKKEMDKLYGLTIHECGHHARPDIFNIMEALPDSTPDAVFGLLNVAEDDGMEREVAGEYRGDRKALSTKNNLILKEITPNWMKANAEADAYAAMTGEPLQPHQFCSQVAAALGQMSRNSWDSISLTDAQPEFLDKALHPIAKELLGELVSEGYVDRLRATRTPDDCLDVAIDLYKRIFPEDQRPDDDECESMREQGHSKEPSERSGGMAQPGSNGNDGTQSGSDGSESDGESGAMGQGDDENEGSLGEGELSDEPPTQHKEGQVIDWKGAVLSEHTEWQPKELGQTPGNIGIAWSDYQQGSIGLMPPGTVNVVDLHRGDEEVEARNGGWYRKCGTPQSFMPDNGEARRFGAQVRRYLQAKARTKVSREKYHGRLDKQSIVRLAMPPIDGGEWNKRVFYGFDELKQLNTCVHILTDWSGSMDGRKMVYAADATGRLIHVMDRVLRVPVQAAAFTNATSPCDIGVIKRFSDKSISPRQVAENFSKFYKYSSANNDADALMWAYRETKRRKEQRKIIIVLSDGCPAGSWGNTSSHQNLLHVTNQIEQDKSVELYGVGICSDEVKTYYKNYRVLNDPTEINTTLFNVIKDGAYRGRR